MAKKKSKYKVNDVFMHLDDEKMYIVDSVDKYPKGSLYTIKEVANGKPEYKRYYEDKLTDKCVKTTNTKAVKILYGRKK